MLIADINSWDNKLSALLPETWDEFLGLWPTADGTEKQPDNNYSVPVRVPQRLTYEEAGRIQALGIKLEIKALPGNQITRLRDHPEYIRGDPEPRDLLNGSAVQIHIADIGLMTIREVTWMENACTEELQRELDAGWCILAVCPPNAQRRPDYILGRTKKG